MRRLVLAIALALAAVGFSAERAQATLPTTDAASACSNVFNICMAWNLELVGDTWTLTTNYVSSPSGVLTGTGIYYNAGKDDPGFGIGGVTLVNPTTDQHWGSGKLCNDLSMNNGSTELLKACGATNGIGNGVVPPDGQVVFTFTTSNTERFEAAIQNGELDYRAHIQGYGPTGCSLKLDTGAQGQVGSAGTDCMPANSVPEPITMALLGTGLAGVGFIRRRRKGTDVVSE